MPSTGALPYECIVHSYGREAQKIMGKLWKSVAISVATAAALLGAAAPGSAASEWQLTDDLEGPDTATTWQFGHEGAGDGQISTVRPHSPTHDALVSISGKGFSSAGRLVTLKPVAAGLPAACRVTVFVRPELSARTANIEVIRPSDFTYVALKTVDLTPGSGYVQQGLAWDAPVGSPSTVLIRVSLLGPTDGQQAVALVDDLAVTCAF